MQEPTFLDCYHTPDPLTARTLYESHHDLETLMTCTTCGTYWFYRFNEWVNWYGGDDDLTSWHTRLTTEEGETLAHNGRAIIDLTFLRERPSWLDDRDGIRLVPGAPDHPAS